MFFISSIFPINLFFILYIALHFQTIVYEKNQPELALFVLVKLVDYILALTSWCISFVNTGIFVSKIILNHRGGYCFELQGAFYYLLKSLGYEVKQYAGRFMDEPGVIQMRRHRISAT